MILCIQLFLLYNNQLLAVETWHLQSVQYLMVFIMLLIGASVSIRSLIYWMKAYVFIAIAWGFTGLFVWFGGTNGEALQITTITMALPPSIKLSGPFNQGNIFAAAIGFAWLFSHWLYIQEKKSIYAIALVFFTALLFDTLSRGGWASYLITCALLLYALKVNYGLVIKKLLPIWLSGLLLGIFFFTMRYQLADSEGITFITETASHSLTARLLIWIAAIIEFINAPLTGAGWGQFQATFWTVKPSAIAWIESHWAMSIPFQSIPYNAHNLFFHILAEAGLIAFFALCWGIYKLGHASIKLIVKGNSVRLPFALAASAFVLQAQINVIFHRPMLLLVAAFFAGIALAPWLWQKSWKIQSSIPVKAVSVTLSFLTVVWAYQLSSQWFKAEQAILSLNVEDKASIEDLIEFTTHPRIGAISLTWLGFTVAQKQQHLPLLTWMNPYLRASVNEVPSILANQVLFYSYSYSQQAEAACRIGRVISSQKIPGENNTQFYKDTCLSNKPGVYIFGTNY